VRINGNPVAVNSLQLFVRPEVNPISMCPRATISSSNELRMRSFITSMEKRSNKIGFFNTERQNNASGLRLSGY
jgi:hypothetical protein